MNNQVSNDIKTSIKTVKDVFGGRIGLYMRFVLFSLTAIVGKMTFIGLPLFSFAEYKAANQIETDRTVDLNQSFSDTKSVNKYWLALLYALLKGTIIVTVFLIILGLYYGLNLMGVSIDDYLDLERYYSVMIVQVICISLLLVSVSFIHVYFGPVMYLISISDDNGLNEILTQNHKMMTKNNGLFKLMYIWIFFLIRFIVLVAFLSLLGYFAFQYFYDHFFIMTLIIFSLVVFVILPRILVMNRLSSIKLFEHMLENAAYESLFNDEGTTTIVNRIRKEDVLSALFDEIIVEPATEVVEQDEVEEIEVE